MVSKIARSIIFLIGLHLVMYVPAAVEALEFDTDKFKMEEQLLMLGTEEFAITPTKHLKRADRAPSTVTVITAGEIKQMGARYLSDVLKVVPGLEFSRDELNFGQVGVRGVRTTQSEKVLFMVDSIPLNSTFGQAPINILYNDYPLEHVKRIEIIRGPGSAIYGTSAFLGVINVITKDGDDLDGFQITGWGGSFDTQSYTIQYGKTSGDFNLMFMLDYFDTNGDRLKAGDNKQSQAPFYDAPGRGPYKETLQDYVERTTGYLKVEYRGLNFKLGYQERDFGSFAGALYVPGDEDAKDIYETFGEVGYRQAVTSKLDASAKVYTRWRKIHFIQEMFPENFELWLDLNNDGNPDYRYTRYPDGLIGDASYREKETGAELQFDYRLAPDNVIILGGVFEHEKMYDVEGRSNADTLTLIPNSSGDLEKQPDFTRPASRDAWALYLQDEWDILPQLSLTMGARYDHYEGFGGSFNPRVGLVWNFVEDATLKLLYGEAFRAPSFNELYMQNNPLREGNPDLDPEKIKTFEAALGYRFTRHISTKATYFYSRITDIIGTGFERNSMGAYLFDNLGGAKIHGVELELKGEYNKDTYTYANYSYQNARDDETGDRLPNAAKHKGNIGVNLGIWKYLNANIYATLIGERPRVQGDTRGNLSGYGVVNLALIAHNFVDGLEIFGSVYNLFDKNYADPAPPNTLPNDFPAPGRSYYAGLRYKF